MVQTVSGWAPESSSGFINQGSALCKQREVGRMAPPSRPVSSLVGGDDGNSDSLKW